jgi:hypothetical protein
MPSESVLKPRRPIAAIAYLRPLLASVIALLLAIGAWVITVMSSARPSWNADALLAEAPTLPDAWNTGEIEVTSVDWGAASTEVFSPAREYRASTSAWRHWSDGGQGGSIPAVTQLIFVYENPLLASIAYWLSRPEWAYSDTWPNFSTYDESSVHPAIEPYASKSADQDSSVCGMGGPSSCQVWIYWSRHGQYIHQVFFFAPNQGIDTTLFGEFVRQFDRQVEMRLSR